MRIIIPILCAVLLQAADKKPIRKAIVPPVVYSSAANFTVDLQGTPDTRPGTWGMQGATSWNITFKPPAGKATKILHVYGDFLAWTPKQILPNGSAGMLLALATTGPQGSTRGTFIADNTILYVQTATNGQPARASYDRDVSAGGLLQPDNILVVKVAVFLNTTGVAIHLEPTFILDYQFQ